MIHVRFLALALCTAPAVAQGLPSATQTPDLRIAAGSGTPSGQSTGRMVAFDMDDDHDKDVAFLYGDEVIVSAGTGLFVSVYEGVATANDIGAFVDDGADQLLVVNSSGFSIVERDVGNDVWTTTAVETSDWEDATLIQVGNRTAWNGRYVYGVMSDERSIRRLHHDGTSWVDEAISDISIPADIKDFVLLDWDDDGDEDIAIVTNTHLYVYGASLAHPATAGDLPNTFTQLEASSSPPLFLVNLVAGEQESGGDTLSYVVRYGTTQWIVTKDENGVSDALALPGVQVEGMAAGLLDLDGNSDVVMTVSTYSKLLALGWHDTSGAGHSGADIPFDYKEDESENPGDDHDGWAGGTVLDLTSPGSANPYSHRRPLLADLDNDGDEDLAIVSGADPCNVEVFKNPEIDVTELTPGLNGVLNTTTFLESSEPLMQVHDAATTSPQLISTYATQITFETTNGLQSGLLTGVRHTFFVNSSSVPTDANAVQTAIWRLEDPVGSSGSPVLLANDVYALPGTAPSFQSFWAEHELETEGETPPVEFANDDAYFILMRYVKANPAVSPPDITRSWPAALWGLSTDGEVGVDPVAVYNYLAMEFQPAGYLDAVVAYQEVDEGALTTPPLGSRVGAVVPVPNVPTFQIGMTPQWRTPIIND